MDIHATIRERSRAWGIRPDKSLGQNFLISETAYETIVGALEIQTGETIIEIGPGLGTLTDYLLANDNVVIAVEKDNELTHGLTQLYKHTPKVQIINSDILRFNVQALNLRPDNFLVVGNIPYYITGKLLRTIISTWPIPRRIVLMVQKEVGQRITAQPPDMSLLAVAIQLYGQTEIVTTVPASAFEPTPEVDSCIILIKPNSQYSMAERKNIMRVATAGFSRKRGQLVNTLSAGLILPKAKIAEILKTSGIEPQQRAETLTLKQWSELTANLAS